MLSIGVFILCDRLKNCYEATVAMAPVSRGCLLCYPGFAQRRRGAAREHSSITRQTASLRRQPSDGQQFKIQHLTFKIQIRFPFHLPLCRYQYPMPSRQNQYTNSEAQAQCSGLRSRSMTM